MARNFSIQYESYKIREEGNKIDPKMIFIAYEGVVTESEYFNLISNKMKSMPQKVVVFPLDRDKEDGNSHPEKVKEGIIEYYNERLKGGFDKKRDNLWIIIDIDKHFKKTDLTTELEVYLEFLSNLITEDGVKINAGISNPSFELWFILHYKTAEELDIEKIKENRKVSKNKTYIKSLYSEILLEGKYLKEKRRRNIHDHFNNTLIAIKNSENKILCNENKELLDKVGTSVGKLLKMILEVQQD